MYSVLHYCIIYVNFISSAVTSHVGRYCCGWSEDDRKSKTASVEVDPKLPKKAVFINFWIVEQLVEVIQMLLMSPMYGQVLMGEENPGPPGSVVMSRKI